MVESSIIKLNGNLIDYNIGTPISVEFNFDIIWKLRKDIYTLNLYHVHPANFLNYSEQDRQIIKGWRIALGIQFNFFIVCFHSESIFDLSCDVINCLYRPKEKKIITIPVVSEFIDAHNLLILKLLSEGLYPELNSDLLYFDGNLWEEE